MAYQEGSSRYIIGKFMRRNIFLKRLLLIGFLTIVILLGYQYRSSFTLSFLKETVISYGIWAPLSFIGIYSVAIIFLLPGSLLTIVGGLIFGPYWGTFYSMSAALLGSSVSFFIARYAAQDWVAHRTKGHLQTLMKGIEEEGWRFVAVVRLVPMIPFTLLNYALGLTRIPYLAYLLASLVFMLPGCFAYSYLGSLGEAVIQSDLKSQIGRIFFGIGLVVLVSCIPWVVKKLRQRSQKEGE